jgi:hypothetical protein
MAFAPLQTVELARDVPEEGLAAGATVVILDTYDDGAAYEVEVLDPSGNTVFVGSLPADALQGDEAPPTPPTSVGDFWARRPEILARLGTATREYERSELRAAYIKLLPTYRVSRCPISNEIVERAIDTVDLDGPWWDFRNPARPRNPDHPTLVSLTGALLLGSVPQTPFLVVPGPERPFVVPRLLGIDDVQAVISWLPVGPHQGYPIAYFAPPPGPDLGVGRLNDWGASSHLVQGPEQIEEREDHPYEVEWDYDLAPWIAAGKLWWIAPGDAELELRSDVESCPYLDLTGHRGITRLQEGEVWWPDDID